MVFVYLSILSSLTFVGLKTPGIFRVSGSASTITAIKNQINRGIDADVSLLDDHVVSGLLKQFLRDMPEPVIPSDQFHVFVNAVNGCMRYLIFI